VLSQTPRLLSLLDRDPLSPTAGSFHRDYWWDKTSDFPDAMTQMGVQPLAILYTCPFPDNPYYRQPKMLEWTLAGLEYWSRIQHGDGSYDEFYPFERGWGTTAFTLYTSVDALAMLGDAVPASTAERVATAARRAARYLGAGEAEQDLLANHHALACLALWRAYTLLGEAEQRAGFERVWRGFLRSYHRPEGWALEYDGADIGYLSGTITFLGKLYQARREPELLQILRAYVEFASYFVYPDGTYAGGVGSRQTVHYYPHGFELLASELPLAGAIAQATLNGLAAGAGIGPHTTPDRYLPWRMGEFALAYRDARARPTWLPELPYQRAPFRRWFPQAGIFVQRGAASYLVANLARGGVLRLYDAEAGRLLHADGGLLGQTQRGKLVSSQWVDPSYRHEVRDGEARVSGSLHWVPSRRYFTPLKMALFRTVLAVLGRSSKASNLLKGAIRRLLILSSSRAPLRFERRVRLDDDALTVVDELSGAAGTPLAELQLGGQFGVRFVPQSRYFQVGELVVRGRRASPDELARLNGGQTLRVERRIALRAEESDSSASRPDPVGAPSGRAEAPDLG
jgi:hypothetical protein